MGLGFSALQGWPEEAGENGGRWVRCDNWAGTGGSRVGRDGRWRDVVCGVLLFSVVGLTVGCHFQAAVWEPWLSPSGSLETDCGCGVVL